MSKGKSKGKRKEEKQGKDVAKKTGRWKQKRGEEEQFEQEKIKQDTKGYEKKIKANTIWRWEKRREGEGGKSKKKRLLRGEKSVLLNG